MSFPQSWFYAFIEFCLRQFAKLPRRLLRPTAIVINATTGFILRKRWRIAKTNIALCFPELSQSEQHLLLKQHRIATYMSILDLLRAWFASDKYLQSMVTIEGLEYIEHAQINGSGIMLLSGHFMHLELALRFLRMNLKYDINGVARKFGNQMIQAIIARGRCEHIGHALDKFDTRRLIKKLRDGAIVAYLADQDFRTQYVFAPFFSVPAATLSTVPRLVESGRAKMMAMWCWRDHNNLYQIKITPAWPDWGADDLSRSAEIYMRELEQAVRRAPEQYLWSHRRFKTRPPGEPNFYT